MGEFLDDYERPVDFVPGQTEVTAARLNGMQDGLAEQVDTALASVGSDNVRKLVQAGNVTGPLSLDCEEQDVTLTLTLTGDAAITPSNPPPGGSVTILVANTGAFGLTYDGTDMAVTEGSGQASIIYLQYEPDASSWTGPLGARGEQGPPGADGVDTGAVLWDSLNAEWTATNTVALADTGLSIPVVGGADMIYDFEAFLRVSGSVNVDLKLAVQPPANTSLGYAPHGGFGNGIANYQSSPTTTTPSGDWVSTSADWSTHTYGVGLPTTGYTGVMLRGQLLGTGAVNGNLVLHAAQAAAHADTLRIARGANISLRRRY